MVQRQSLFGRRPARRSASTTDSLLLPPDPTVPGIQLIAPEEPTILGFPVEEETASGPLPAVDASPPTGPALEHQVRVVALPRADPLAGITLVLAGVAGAASLLKPWRAGD